MKYASESGATWRSWLTDAQAVARLGSDGKDCFTTQIETDYLYRACSRTPLVNGAPAAISLPVNKCW